MWRRCLGTLAGSGRASQSWFETRFWKLVAIDPSRWWTTLKTREGKAFVGIALAALLFGIADFVTMPPPLPSYRQVVADWHPSEAWLYDRHGRLLDSARVNFAARRLGWTPLDKVSQVTRDTLIAAEDRRFYSHGGVDWLALAGAARDRVERRRSRGASTLSMQVAGFLIPDLATPGARSWLDKLRQMRAAWALERGWSKDEILAAYLNLAGYRGEAQGIGAAELGQIGQAPDALAKDDALLLAALLPEPQANAAV